jgi:hypothetical protein
MGKLSREKIEQVLIEKGIEFDPEASYGDLCKLMPEVEIVPPEPVVKTASTDAELVQVKQAVISEITAQDYAKQGIKPIKEVGLAPAQQLEKMIRRYVMRIGGFRVGLNIEQIEYAKMILKKSGRELKDGETPMWDMNIALPGYNTI